MDDRPDPSFDDLDLDLARRIDVICRRFEADWREGRQPCIEQYMDELPEEGQPALRAEMEALERELRQSEEAAASGSDSEAPTIAELIHRADPRPVGRR